MSSDQTRDVEFGRRIARLRENCGWSREQLREASGLDLELLEQIERGELSPTLATLRRLAGALKLQLSELFEGEP
jgi:transcriptional regulator with XRE-family HTH domain